MKPDAITFQSTESQFGLVNLAAHQTDQSNKFLSQTNSNDVSVGDGSGCGVDDAGAHVLALYSSQGVLSHFAREFRGDISAGTGFLYPVKKKTN